MSEGLWVYGVLDGGAPEPHERGVDPAHGAELIRHAELAALVSKVPLDRFGEAALREALEELDHVERLARAHQCVLDEALRHGPVLPFRVCTIYESEARVRELLQRERETLAAALAHLRGKAEWGVKAYAPLPTREQAASAPASSGAAYLARKAAQRDEAKYSRERLGAAIATVHERLRATSESAVLSPAQDRRLSGRSGEMVLNASYLVADGDAPAFASLVAELAASYGIALELTGPWPAYHFSG